MRKALIPFLLCALVGSASAAYGFDLEGLRPLPPGTVRVTKKERVLLLTVNLSKFGDPKYAWLYKFLDSSSVFLAHSMMSGKYRATYLLGGANATARNFVRATGLLTAAPDIKALDTFIHLHGSPGGTAWFVDGGFTASDLRESLAAFGASGKLRLLYSTACYGAAAAPEFVAAGYQAASGAIAVNSDSSWAYPTTMLKWGCGKDYSKVVKAANSPASIYLSDHAAMLMGFTDVNSKKLLFGDPRTRIDAIRK